MLIHLLCFEFFETVIDLVINPKLKAKLQMEENLVEKLTAIRDALERGKLIHRFEGLGKGPKLGEHLMMMGAKEQK